MGGVLAKIVFKSGEEALPACSDSLQDIEIIDIDGQLTRIGEMVAGKKVIMFVNVATK
jgi:hypothetical protein